MVSNVGQANDGHVEASSTAPVVSQGFRTGSDGPYRLQGIAVNVEGSDDMGTAQVPDGASSVTVALYADSNGKPGTKLHDLTEPAASGAGHTFFEAPAGTSLQANTSYVVVWTHDSGTNHRLQTTDSDDEDLVRLTGFSIADSLYHGASLTSLSAHTDGNVLEIAVFGTVPSRVEGGFQVSRGLAARPRRRRSGVPVPGRVHRRPDRRHVRGHGGLQRRGAAVRGTRRQRRVRAVDRPASSGRWAAPRRSTRGRTRA